MFLLFGNGRLWTSCDENVLSAGHPIYFKHLWNLTIDKGEISLIVMFFDIRVHDHFCKNSVNEHLLKICSIFVSSICWKVSSVCVTATSKIYYLQQLETFGKCSVCFLSLWCATFLAVQVLFSFYVEDKWAFVMLFSIL